ncbi:type VI secretion system-associated protein TagF [Nitrincola sp. MINF-07-Sa-05]|uniref:type VI secretion system-associated protein TagF n=1 Tax=Nitrincola salilacus TaxID=3400273 RepID=UPI003917ED39
MGFNIAVYGKLPAHSDYVLLNFPAAVETELHQWSVRVLSETEHALGREQWLQAFLKADPCCFVLHAKCPDSVSIYGVMIPSVDRVGRYFPLFSGLLIKGHADFSKLDKQLLSQAMQVVLDEQIEALHGRKQVDLLFDALLSKPVIAEFAAALDRCPSMTPGRIDTKSDPDTIAYSCWWEFDRPERLYNTAGMPPVEYYQSILTREPVRHE